MSDLLDCLRRDLRSTVRTLAARPAWTAAAIVCLAIATGANTAAFTVVNGLLLRPLPFDDPQRLVVVAIHEPQTASTRPFSLREYRDVASRSASTGMLLARTFFPLSLVSTDGARMAQAELVSGNYFETLRVRPFMGHFFDGSADREGTPPLVVLSHRLWQLRFDGNADVIGQSVRVNGRPAVIAAVAPAGFVGAMQLVAADLWLPAAMYPDLAGSADSTTVPMFGVMGRLADGVTIAEAEAQITSTLASLDRGAAHAPLAAIVKPATGFGVPVAVQGTILTLSGIIYVMMALLMSVACANVAALVLARGAGRHREIAVRLSLGGSRARIARQLLTESVVLAVAGCTAGTILAVWLTGLLVARLATPFQYVSYAIDVHRDARVFAYSAIATAAAAVLCGIAPIRSAGKVDVVDAIKQSAAKGGSHEGMRTLNTMIVVQFAVSTTLLVAAGLLVRTYIGVQSMRPAFDTTGLVTSTLDVDQVRLDRTAGIQLYRTITERLAAIPGVIDVALTRDAPFTSGSTKSVVARAGSRTDSAERTVSVGATAVSPRFVKTLGLVIRQGRSFEEVEPSGASVAMVNEAMARHLWPDASPLGQTFRIDRGGGEQIEVIGVVSNGEEGSLDRPAQPAFYQPFPYVYAPRMTVVMRVQREPPLVFADIRRTIRDVNEDLSIVDLRTVDDWLDLRADQRRIPAAALTVVGLLGLLLSAVGLYGVVAYGVRERTRELGIRLALGARPADVRRLVLRQGFTIMGVGLAIGTAATLAFAQFVRSTLFGVRTIDPLTLAVVYGVLVTTALAALYVPARWASAVEPAQTLRSE
jgi:putative ABC transport system permease protein